MELAAIHFSTPQDELERSLINQEDLPNDEKREEIDDYLDSIPEEPIPNVYEELVRKGDEEPPPIELKPLPDDLRYEYLDDENKCPIIISKGLSENETNKLISVLSKQREAFGYTLSDIKGLC